MSVACVIHATCSAFVAVCAHACVAVLLYCCVSATARMCCGVLYRSERAHDNPPPLALSARPLHTRPLLVSSSFPSRLLLGSLLLQVVFACDGVFKTRALLAPVLAAGVRRIVVSAPVKDEDVPDVVVGVNDAVYDPRVHDIVTAASCTTNCLAPVVKVREGRE